MRGAPEQPAVVTAQIRLTPAGAGSTGQHQPTLEQHGAYPRRCGEHVIGADWVVVVHGLPPQVRGALRQGLSRPRVIRLTPAGAGSTPLDPSCDRPWTAYPRRCGEHPAPTDPGDLLPGLTPAGAGSTNGHPITTILPMGLPPQVRGAHDRSPTTHRHHGLTPAGAGSTTRPCHPRSRVRGLPPQVRGAPGFSPSHGLSCGLTPRRCGEHDYGLVNTAPPAGLPPQVRGARHNPLPRRGLCRLTPAGAGSTPPDPSCARRQTAYPRRCGEHRFRRLALLLTAGLPPQVRGAPQP